MTAPAIRAVAGERVRDAKRCIVRRSRPHARGGLLHVQGFTFIELMLGVAILSVLGLLAFSSYSDYREKVRVAQAVYEIKDMDTRLQHYFTENGTYPDTLAGIGRGSALDPWGRPYQYTNLGNTHGRGAARKNKNLVPINSDFDLYSLGEDGRSNGPLTARASRDDIIRANDGRFVGLASDYDP